MSKVRYVDIPAIVQVIGCVYQNPNLIDDERYNFTAEDFTEDLHKVVFGAIYNLHNLGVEKITTSVIEDYLLQKPKKMAVYKKGSVLYGVFDKKQVPQVPVFCCSNLC